MAPIKIKYSEEAIRNSIRSYWWKHDGLFYLSILIPLAAFISYRIVLSNVTWITVSVGIGAFIGAVFMVITYVDYTRQSLNQLGSMKLPEAILELEEEQFRLTSDAGVLEIPWNSVKDIWQFDKVWFLVFSRHKIMSLPVSELDHDLKFFIADKVESNGLGNAYINRQTSVIYCTKQNWKVNAMPVYGVLSALLLVVLWFIDSLSHMWFILFSLAGLSLVLSSMFIMFTIRCPACRSHWASESVRSQCSKSWPNWLLALKKCPACGKTCIELADKQA